MACDDCQRKKEDSYMGVKKKKKPILGQAARLLVSEKLIDPEEQLRFLALLEEET